MGNISWKAVAHELGVRLNHAFCTDHADDTQSEHCPFCKDVVAYRNYKDKVAGVIDVKWDELASVLAERLRFAGCDDHNKRDKDCPYCEDVAAYKLYVKRLAADGYVIVDPFEGAVSVPIHELPNNPII